MKHTQSSIKNGVKIVIPETILATFLHICNEKGLDPEKVASLMVYSACRALEETPPQKDSDLLADLDFSKGLKDQNSRRLDNLLGVAEKVLLDSQGIQAALRNRTFGT